MSFANLKRFVGVAALSWVSVISTASAQSYTLTDLGTLGADTFAFGVNKSGQITGISSDSFAGQFRAFLYNKGQLAPLGEAGGLRSSSYRINDAGVIAGEIQDNQNFSRAVVWKDGAANFIGSLGGASAAIGINQAGDVVGASAVSIGGPQHAFLYNGTSMLDLGTLGGLNSVALAVNRSGQVVGHSDIQGVSGDARAFLYSNGVMTNLGSLFGGISGARDINDSGDIVGYSYVASIGNWRATLWENDGVIQDLGTGSVAPGSWANAINNKGVIVGTTQGHPSGVNRALIWRNGTAIDLNNLVDSSAQGWVLESAMDVNVGGAIVGYGKNSSGQTRAILLTPVTQRGKNR